jgi:UPF0042 nucleotide-binding protein
MAKSKKLQIKKKKHPPSGSKPLVVFVTGLSGAGISTALNAMADSGMHCIDNLPVELLDQTIGLIANGSLKAEHGFGFGMAYHNESFVEQLPQIKKRYTDFLRLEIIFLTAEENVIATRYSTTRRRHPLIDAGETLNEAIAREQELLSPIEELADSVIDTSSLSPHALARAVEERFLKELPARTLHITITSFGFKYGQYKPLDMLFDVRFLKNPHFVTELRPLTGLDKDVVKYVFANQEAKTMFAKMEDMLGFLLPLYYQEGKHYFRIGIGCSGGRHRSVVFAEKLGEALLRKDMDHFITTVIHRDIDNE